MEILPKLTYRLNAIPTKISFGFLAELMWGPQNSDENVSGLGVVKNSLSSLQNYSNQDSVVPSIRAKIWKNGIGLRGQKETFILTGQLILTKVVQTIQWRKIQTGL